MDNDKNHQEYEECECGFTVWVNEDGMCYHRACSGRHDDCGELVQGTPTEVCHAAIPIP